MNNRTVYALCVVGGDPFYVGITNDIKRRYSEHKSSSKTGTEAKYQYIRNITAQGKDWELIPLEEITDTTPRYEDFWVYTLILEGYNLQNEKAGDARQAAEQDAMLELRKRGQRFSTAEEFFTARDREIAEAESRKRAEKLQKQIRKETKDEFIDWERMLFPGEKPHEKFISPAMRAIQARQGHIHKGRRND